MNAILEQVNSAGLKFVEFALPMFVQSAVLIVILLLADFALRKKVRAVFRYWIWLLVLVKLVLPTSLSSPMSLGYFFGDRLTYVDTTETPAEPQASLAEPVPASIPPFIDLTNIEADRFTSAAPPLMPVTEQLKEPVITSPAAPQAISVTPLSWKGAVFLTWLIVVIAMVLLLLQRAVFVRGLVAQAKEANGVMAGTLESCRSSMSVKRKLGLKISANATSPAVCGLFRPVILIPQNLASSLTAGQLRAILMHELAHIRRGDLFVNLAQTVLQIVYFYNPLLWLANAIIRRVREQAVDEMVLVAMGEKAPQYPQTLVSVAKLAFKRPALSLRLIGVVESKSALAGRIKHILNRPLPRKAKLGILGLVVVIFTAAILLPMAACKPGSPSLVIKGMVEDAQTGEPIAGARVFDDGYAHEPVWEQIHPDVRSEWGAITNSAGQYSFLTWHEHHTIKVEAPGYKPQRRNLYNGHFTFNKKDQEIFDFTLDPENNSDSSEFKTTLPNGVTVELIGLCEHPIKGNQWWRPDGGILSSDHVPSDYSRMTVKPGETEKARELALRFSGPDVEHMSFRWKIDKAARSSSHPFYMTEKREKLKPQRNIVFKLPRNIESLNFNVGVAVGEWKSVASGGDGRTMSGTNDSLTDSSVIFHEAIKEKDTVRLSATHLLGDDYDCRIIAVDKNDKLHEPTKSSNSGSDMRLCRGFFNLPPGQIKYILLQARPYQWIEFKNVSLKPNFKTDVQIEGEEAWGEVVEGLRVRWVHPNEPIVRGTAPVLTMEVENVSSKQIIWECSSGFTWGLNVHGVSPANSLTMPKFRVQVGPDASPEYPGGKTGPEPQPTDYYKLEPEGRIRLSCALPWVLPDPGQYTVKGVVWRRRSKTVSLEMGCSSLVLNVVNPTSASDKLAYWGAADTLTGLQLGLSFDLQARPYHQGEVISFKAHVRNTGDKIIKLVYFGLLGWGPTIFDSNGEIVSVLTPILGFPVQKQNLFLNPGETQSVGTVFLELQPEPDTRWDDKSVYPRCYLTPGTYRVSQKYRFADDPEASWYGELTTGELELTILRKLPDMQVEGKKNNPPVWLALLPRSPIRSTKELYLYFWGSSLVSDRTKIDSFELEIRSARDNVRIARIDSKSMITVHSSKGEVLRWSMFRDGLRENMIRRIGPLEDGEYLIAIYVNGIRSSNVAKFTVDSSFDGSNEPTLQVVPLVPAPGKKLQYFGLRATGPTPQDSELTNMALHFPDIIVDGVPRKILARSWSGPVYPLKPGQQHEEILLLNYYKPEIDLSRKHTVKAIVGRYESAPVEIVFDRSLELAWDEATPTIKSRPPRPPVLEGRIIGPDGKPGIGYRVCLYADPGRDQFIEYSDKDGKYDFPNVPTGSYRLTCRPSGNSEPALTFEQFQIEAGKTIVQELSLEGKYAFSGRVTYEDGSPAAGVKIVGRWEIGAGKVFRDLSVTDENGYYELTSPFELARYISLTIFTADGVPAQGSYEHIGVRGPRTDVDFIVKRREIHAAIWPEKFARMGGKHPDFQPVPVPEGWDYLRLLQALYEHLETQCKARFPDCRATLKDEVIELSFNTRDYNIIRPGNAERTGMQRGNDRGIGPEPDGLVLTVHFSKTAGQFDRPYIIDRSPWTGFISQVYLPDVKLYLNVDIQYGTGINEKLLTDLCAPTIWLKTIFNNFNERTPERNATAGAVEKGSQPNVQAVSEIDWVIEDYGQTRLLSDKEKPDTDNWVSIWASAVKNKGRYLVPERGLTLKGLIKAAGYNRDKLAQSYVELIRRSRQGDITARSTYSRNLKTLLTGEESDIVIKSQDAVAGGYIEPSANGVEFWSGYNFGEVVELTVNDDGAKINMFADLDTGKFVTPPDTLDFDDENAVLRWIKDNGIDVMGETASSVHGLIGFNMYATRVDNYFWDAGPQEVTDRLMVRIDDPVLLSVDNLLPVTYLIKTSKYKMGILQILGFAENPEGIKIRYKLLNKEAVPKPDLLIEAEPLSLDWRYIGQSIPPDFNDTMILTEHVNLGSIGHDAEGKTFITLFRDREKTKGCQYRFVLFNKAGNILEPDGYVVLDRGERLEEKFTFDEPFITRRLKGFRFQTRSLPPSGFDNISSILQKVAPEVVKDEILLPSTSNLAPPGLYAVELDGVDDYLLVPDSPSLRLEPPFTVEMWVKTKLPPDASEYRGGWALISKGFTVGTPRAYLTGFGINLQRFPKEPSNLHIDFCKANNSGTYSAMYAGYPLTNGVSDWIHITHVFDGEYYKSTPGHPLVMGKFLIPTNDPFKGLLGEVRLWNGARTRQELRQYENHALTGTEPGLAACWTFEQTKGRYAYDISGNNNHARLGKFTGPDDADPKWVELQPPPPQPDQETNLQVEDKRSRGEGIMMLEGFYSFGEGESYSRRLSQIFSKAQTYIEQMSADYENKDWDNVSESAKQVRNIFFGLKEAIEVDDTAAWEAFTKMWKGEKTDENDVRLVDLARLKHTFKIFSGVGGEYREETYQKIRTSIVSIADVAYEIQKTLRTKRPTMISSHIEKLQADWAVLAEIDGIKKIFPSGFQTKDKTDLQVKADASVTGKDAAAIQGRDYESAIDEPQPIELWKVDGYGVGGSQWTGRKLQTYVKRKYPVQFVWPLIEDASKYVIQIHGLRGSQPAKSFESVTNRLHLNESDISPGRYQWSVSVYDEQGKLISDIATIEPDEIFAIEDPEPVEKNGKTAMIDLNHSAGHMRGWGYYNHAQYMTKELLENAGFEVQVNDRDLLTGSSLKSVDLLICNYYWAGWPAFRPYLKSELSAVRKFVEDGGSLLVIGCDGKDGGGNMCKAGNELLSQFGLTFEQGKISKGSGMAKTESRRDIMSFDKSFLIQLPVSVLGDDALTLLRFEAEPIVKARQFGQGRVIAAGVGMSFLDCYLADFQNREPLYMIMFYDFVRYLTPIDWKHSCKQDFIEKILSRCQF